MDKQGKEICLSPVLGLLPPSVLGAIQTFPVGNGINSIQLYQISHLPFAALSGCSL